MELLSIMHYPKPTSTPSRTTSTLPHTHGKDRFFFFHHTDSSKGLKYDSNLTSAEHDFFLRILGFGGCN